MSKKRILILGGGFAGVYCAKELEKLARNDAGLQVSLVSRENFFVFTPMLPQVVSGMIESNHVVVPVRQILKRTQFYEADVRRLDVKNKKVAIGVAGESGPERVLEYDQLVVSLGGDTNFAKMPYIQGFVFTLKNLKDALVLRNHVIDMLERADIEGDIENRQKLLTFVVVGGGLSGAETAGELASFFDEAVKYYPNVRNGLAAVPVRVVLLQSRDRILPELDLELADFTLNELVKSGVEVRLNSRVVDVTADHVEIMDGKGRTTLPANTTIWTAGVSPNPVVFEIPGAMHESGRLPVDSFLRVKGADGIWAIGDCAYIADGRSAPCPPTAQHAIREAQVAAQNILLSMQCKGMKRFDYDSNKQMAVIGEKKAIARFAGFKLYGIAAWWLWRAVYLQKLPMLKKRLRVLFDWTIDMFFDRDLTHIRGLKDDRKVARSLPARTQ
ncbi:NAD(P)/FAD-dependent oxidoreductase [Nitrososphaera sp.]|uniref:NAD(P)/FAD-dependent oxidoreductase n=1 Tax=Nitrososphaera sp. TaxID=1971748 RepID=UPI0017E3AA31|nr:NAD(P)/FAD-dependent oxidoreductase [Nitrososphaera sp.]NWG37117.1 NAD(P)/FAD-dependent oxidoreductase [Nitrososphaera sp.]